MRSDGSAMSYFHHHHRACSASVTRSSAMSRAPTALASWGVAPGCTSRRSAWLRADRPHGWQPFPMPFIIEPDHAARSICNGLEQERTEIVFPGADGPADEGRTPCPRSHLDGPVGTHLNHQTRPGRALHFDQEDLRIP